MGYAQLGVFSVLAIATLTLGASLFAASDAANTQIDRARADRDARAADLVRTTMSIAAPVHVPVANTATLTITNTGSATLDAGDVDVILDGTWKTGDITSYLVEGSTTDIWGPGQDLVMIVADVTTSPVSVRIITAHGATSAWGL